MAPHPMYSIGYLGYYGISLMCASYTVLIASIAAHALQFAFLILVETPHIEKIYNPPAAIKRQPVVTTTTENTNSLDQNSNYLRRDLIGFKNFDLFRSTDIVAAMIMFYAIMTPLLVQGRSGISIAIVQAFAWRAIHSLGNGAILRAQSNHKFFTRHFIKWGGGVQEAFQNWKSLYNLTLSMTYVTFFIACWKTYTLPDNWAYGTTLLRHILGSTFISLHIWTSVSIHEVIGDFGWYRINNLYICIYIFFNFPLI